MKKKLLSLLLALVLIIGLLPGTVWAAGVSEISTVGEFESMDATGNYKLMKDITVTAPFGSTFTGIFDGNGHTITLGTSGGLFAYNKGTIKNLITVGSVTGAANTGAIVGLNEGVIQNCGNSATVSGTSQTGGIAGYTKVNSSAKIIGCYNSGDITGSKNVGGIVGTLEKGTVNNCYNTGTVKYQSTSKTATGGIAGKASSSATITNCYTTGTITSVTSSAASQVGAFIGYTTSGLKISNNYYLTGAYTVGIGSNNDYPSTAKSEGEMKSAEFATELGGAYKPNDNAYPTLAPPDTKSSLSISGTDTIYVKSGAGENQTTLTVGKINMDGLTVSEVSWSIEKKGGGSAENIAALKTIENSTDSIIVKPVKGGVATVTASVTVDGQAVTKSIDIIVIPNITTAEIKNVSQPGAVAMGQTVEAKVNIFGGGEYDYANYPTLTYQWKHGSTVVGNQKTFTIPAEDYNEGDYLSLKVSCGAQSAEKQQSICSESYGKLYPVAYYAAFTLAKDVKDDAALNLPTSHTVGGVTAGITWSSSNTAINANNGAVTRPESGVTEVTLTAEFTFGGACANREFKVAVWSKTAVEEELSGSKAYLQAAKSALGSWYKLTPIYGTDTNVATMLSQDLTEKNYGDVAVSVKSVTEIYGNCGISDKGDVTYFYADPNGSQGVWFGRYNVTFTLTKDGSSLELQNVPVTIYWDVNKVKDTMTESILSGVIDTSIFSKNDSPSSVTANLTLPKVVDNKKWTQVAWTSSDPSAILISSENQGTADTLFNPYVGKVIRGVADKTVTLTAAFTFKRTNDIIGSEQPIVMYKTFDVTVKALAGKDAESARAALLEKLNTGFTAAGLRDYVTGKPVTANAGIYSVSSDILFPTTHDYGVDGKDYPVTISSDDPKTIVAPDVANAARVSVYRPAVGQSAVIVKLTVTMADNKKGISVYKEFKICVLPLTQQEITDELALMEKVKSHYFDGIKSANSAADNITGNLHAFQEAYLNKGTLTWVYDSKDVSRCGIVPVAMDGWYDLQVWRLFKSNNAAVISHENMLVTRAENAKAVTIQSALSSEVFGKYGERYIKDPSNNQGYAALAGLYYQTVSADVVVRGTKDPASSQPVAETLNVSFTLQSADSTWIGKTAISGLEEGSTVFDVFTQKLAQNGYSYGARGSYIYYITNPGGITLEELDAGKNSGWMYKVNGVTPSSYMAAYPLKNGDNVVVFFTKDYTQDVIWSDSGASQSGGNVTPEVTAQSGKAEATVDSQAVTSALSQNSGKVVIAPKITGSAESVSVSIPATSVKEIAENASGTLSVQSDCGSVSIPNGTLDSVAAQAGGSDIKMTIELKSAKNVNLPASDLENAAIVEINISSGGKNITSFGGGSLGVSIPVTGNYKTGDTYKVIVISADGTVETLVGKVVINNGKASVEVTVKHLSTFVVTDTPIVAFDDVRTDAWYYDAVQYAALNGIMKGVGETSFAPNAEISRAMLVTLLYRLAGAPAISGENSFTDVAKGVWYTDSVIWASKNGIVEGYGDGAFGVNDIVTREQLAAVLYRYSKYKGLNTEKTTSLEKYSDAGAIGDFARSAMDWANAEGLITGVEKNTIAPKGKVSRAQAATILMRFCENTKK